MAAEPVPDIAVVDKTVPAVVQTVADMPEKARVLVAVTLHILRASEPVTEPDAVPSVTDSAAADMERQTYLAVN